MLFSISGVGAGAGSSIFGFLTRSTRPEERAGIFAAIMACRQAGLLVGQFLLSSSYRRQGRHFTTASVFVEKYQTLGMIFDIQFQLREGDIQ